jgi:hypothetical protein
MGVQIGQKTAACFVVRVGHVIAALRTFSRDLTYSGHCLNPCLPAGIVKMSALL